MANAAAFTLASTPSSDPVTGNRGYDAQPSEVVVVQLEQQPVLDALRVTYAVWDVATKTGPFASGDAPQATFPGGVARYTPASAGAAVNLTLPDTSFASWIVEAEAVTAKGVVKYSRMVAIKNGAARAIVPNETTEYSARGWADAINDVVSIGGTTYKEVVRLATAAALPSYNYAGGVITATAFGALTVDGVAVSGGDRVLVTQAVNGAHNGIYVVTAAGSGGTAFVLTRASDADDSTDFSPGMVVPVLLGTLYAGRQFTLSTPAPIDLDTTVLTFISGETQLVVGALVAELRALPGTPGQIYHLKGYSTPGDGGQGTFRYESTAKADDDGTSFNSGGYGSSSAGWRRIFSGPIKAEWFGVLGDCLEGTASTTSGSANVTCAGLTSADIGKLFAVDYAGTAGDFSTRKALFGTIVNVVGTTVTLDTTAGATVSNKPARWGTNDATALQRWLYAVNATLLGILPYNAQEGRLRGGKQYLVHRADGFACLNLNSFQKITGDKNAALVALSDDDIILNMACEYNEVHGLQFKYGKCAILLCGLAKSYLTFGDIYIGNPANAQSVVQIGGCQFYYQRGPSIWQDITGPGANRVISGHIDLFDFEFYGNTLFLGAADGLMIRNGWVIVETERQPVMWDDARPMGAIVNTGDTLVIRDTSAAPITASTAAWIEGYGNITTRGFRAGGENGRPCFCLRTSGLTYSGQTYVLQDGISTTLSTDSDAWASTSTKHFIEIEDVFPTALVIKRVQPFSQSSDPRDALPFGNPDCTIWVDSSTIDLDDLYAQSTTGLKIELDVTVPVRFVYSADRSTGDGQDISERLAEYAEKGNSPETPRAAFNYWWTTGTGGFPFDATWGIGTSVNNVDAEDVQLYGHTVRSFFSTTIGNGANGAFYLDNNGPVKWGADAPAGFYTLSVYVVANYAGSVIFVHDAAQGGGQPRPFVPSTFPQRLSWSFWHNGNDDVSLALTVASIPGTLVTAGAFTLGLPMINAGREAAAYTLPGLTLADGGEAGDSADFGMAYNGGRTLGFHARHETLGTDPEAVATLTVAPFDQLLTVVAIFHGRKTDGTSFSATRKAVFKRESGTSNQIGSTVSLGDDFADAGASSWQATIYLSGDDIIFEVRDAVGSVPWDVDVQLSIQVVS